MPSPRARAGRARHRLDRCRCKPLPAQAETGESHWAGLRAQNGRGGLTRDEAVGVAGHQQAFLGDVMGNRQRRQVAVDTEDEDMAGLAFCEKAAGD